MQMALADPSLISLAAGFVDQASLPVEDAALAVQRICADRAEGRRALQYGTTAGDVSLRKALLERLEQEEGEAPGAFADLLPRTIITTGSQQLLYLLAEALLDPGDIVLVESPTYFVFLGVLQAMGARVIGLETDDQGLCLESLDETLANLKAEGLLPRVKLVYTVSEHSNPSGISLAEDRRRPLLDLVRGWSTDHRIFILEDAAYRGLTYDGFEPKSVWGHDQDGDTVVLARTFSKTYSPGLKTGYGVLPLPLVEPVLRLKGNHDFGSSNFNEVLLDHLTRDGSLDRQIQILQDAYRKKRDVMLGALADYLGDVEGVSWTHPKGGLYVWLSLPESVDTGFGGVLFQACLSGGVLYVPGSYAFAESSGPPPSRYIRLCYGVPGEADLAEGVRRLALALGTILDALPARASGS